MTYSNGAFCPHPLANPLNTLLGPANYSLNPLKGVQRKVNANKQCLEVPNQDVPMFGTPDWEQRYGQNQQKLTVPNQDTPEIRTAAQHGFLPGTSFFKCLDGTVIDFKTGKIICKPECDNSMSLGDSGRVIASPYDTMKCHSSDRTYLDRIVDIVANGETLSFADDSNDDIVDLVASAEYWLKAKEESEKMMSSMTDEQKKMIADFESHFPKSRLVEECKKMSKSLKQI